MEILFINIDESTCFFFCFALFFFFLPWPQIVDSWELPTWASWRSSPQRNNERDKDQTNSMWIIEQKPLRVNEGTWLSIHTLKATWRYTATSECLVLQCHKFTFDYHHLSDATGKVALFFRFKGFSGLLGVLEGLFWDVASFLLENYLK